jgi:glutathione S-transferase
MAGQFEIIGMMDSPYVRRVTLSATLMEIPFAHRSVSVFRHLETFRSLNPLVKAPTIVFPDGEILVESQLILEYLESCVPPERRLMPRQPTPYRAALQAIGWALVACEKSVQVIYEMQLRPSERRHEPWIERVRAQLAAAWQLLEERAARAPFLAGDGFSQADLTTAVAWRFATYNDLGLTDARLFPALEALSQRAERMPAFAAWPVDHEGHL